MVFFEADKHFDKAACNCNANSEIKSDIGN